QFLEEVASKGEAVNLVFEEGLFSLGGILQKIAAPLVEASIHHEVVGGLAVLIHVEDADPADSVLTREVDLYIRRSDLDGVLDAAGLITPEIESGLPEPLRAKLQHVRETE